MIRIYRERDKILLRMGFKSYKAYLASDLWKRIKAKVLRISSKCVVCGRPATQIHHRSYDYRVLVGMDCKSLEPLCAKHHIEIEYGNKSGLKLSTETANGKLRMLRNKEAKYQKKMDRNPMVIEMNAHLDSIISWEPFVCPKLPPREKPDC